MIVNWEVNDGYCGKSRPQQTVIPDEELVDCETELEREELIQEYVSNDFNSKISWEETSRE